MPIRTNRGRAAVYRKVWGWPMRSPTHFVVILVVVAALILTIGILIPQLSGSDDGRPGGAAASTSSGDPTTTEGATTTEDQEPGDTEGSGTTNLPTRITSPPQRPTSAEPAGEALDVAESWGKAWVDHPDDITTEKWLDGLRPYTTEEYLVEMATVDPANVPATKVTGRPKATESFTSSVTVELPTDGGDIAITVIDTPQGWRVAFYEQVG
ncbi:MAG: hypothetical protein GEV28_27705 [Actinophytocola sp.]|uniref:hypothetical protein n=1 Tax=Actinophytocola sp. TaxID=1872138 RepID=UPI001325222E|nr:hypothetical protein [Actinophytocola sp.]MPZ83971.1 hypothetical protein [Actinophytocola sp.]